MDKRQAARPRRTRGDSARVEPAPQPEPEARDPAASAGAAGASVSAPAAEIELKLSISAEDAHKLGRLPAIRRSASGRARTQALHSVYYDTPEFDLRRSGVALRLRRDRGRWIQTLKGACEVQGGLHLRQELDTPVPAQILNYHALAGASPVFSDPLRPAAPVTTEMESPSGGCGADRTT
jgi:hypothetical protein